MKNRALSVMEEDTDLLDAPTTPKPEDKKKLRLKIGKTSTLLILIYMFMVLLSVGVFFGAIILLAKLTGGDAFRSAVATKIPQGLSFYKYIMAYFAIAFEYLTTSAYQGGGRGAPTLSASTKIASFARMAKTIQTRRHLSSALSAISRTVQ